MKRLFTALAVLLVIFTLGPRARWEERELGAMELPPDLDAWLADRESKIPGIRSGLEKGILWHDPVARGRTPLALAYLHGFSASRGEISPVVENTARNISANVFFTRLRGHGIDGTALSTVSTRDWIEDGAEALAISKRIGERTILVGTSTGAVLATWLAAKTTDVDGLVLISPNFALKDKRSRILHWPWGLNLVQALTGRERSWAPENELQAQYWTTSYPLSAVLPMLALVREVSRLDLSQIKVPLLMIYTRADDRIDTEIVPQYFERFGSAKKRLVHLDEAKTHVLAGNATSPATVPATVSLISDFLKELAPSVAK